MFDCCAPPGGEFIIKQSPNLLPLFDIPHPLKRENAFYINKGIENAPLNSFSFFVDSCMISASSLTMENGLLVSSLEGAN